MINNIERESRPQDEASNAAGTTVLFVAARWCHSKRDQQSQDTRSRVDQVEWRESENLFIDITKIKY